MAYIFHFPRPRSFLHFVSLRTATEFLTLTLLVNKITGLYGILALFTGYGLNPLQLSHYIYSLIICVSVAWLANAIRKPEAPLKNVALAWVFVLDTAVNIVYTTFFGMGWFWLLAQHLNESIPLDEDTILPGTGTLNDTAGFTDPEHDVKHVNVVATPQPGLLSGQQAVAYGSPYGNLGSAVFQSGSIASLTILGMLWIVRLYFCLVVMSHARSKLRQYVVSTSASYASSEDPSLAENPFRVGRDEGAGWGGKLGRMLLRLPSKRYWLGKDEDEDEWVRATSGRFEGARDQGTNLWLAKTGVGERERRARSGTGPPPPPSLSLKSEKISS